MPAVLVSQNDEASTQKRRVELCPEEWTDDFGDEFYEHTLENGFYYIAPNSEWQSQAESVPAPGMEQYAVPSETELQSGMERIMKGANNTDGGD